MKREKMKEDIEQLSKEWKVEVDKAKAAEEEDVADETRADEAAAVTARSLTPSPGPQARVVGVVAGQPRR